MTTQVDPRQPRILDDHWEPPPRPNRRPAVIAATVLLVTSAVFATIRAGVWERDTMGLAQATQPLTVSRTNRLWYPDSEALGSPAVRPVGVARAPRTSAPTPPPPPRPTPRATAKLPGSLSVNSTPWAELSVDGVVVGNTPQIRIRVTPGRHHLVLVRAGFERNDTWVTVAPGATVKMTGIRLKALAP